jgi:hypothetical protein
MPFKHNLPPKLYEWVVQKSNAKSVFNGIKHTQSTPNVTLKKFILGQYGWKLRKGLDGNAFIVNMLAELSRATNVKNIILMIINSRRRPYHQPVFRHG